ncbi:MAG: ATP-binding protein [Cytophagales bacterium]|nr:ATP-binding protein [Cytophagales bacterium]
MNEVKIKIPSIPENIRIVESFVDNAKEDFKINDDLYGNIMISLTESVNNAILHGNKSEKNKIVELSLKVDEKAVKFTVKDEGEGFDYDNIDDPTAPENLTKIGGRGIFLMQSLCDELNFNEAGTEVELVFNKD